MKLISFYTPYRIYNTISLKTENNKKDSSSCIFLTDNRQNTIDFINSNFFSKQLFRSLYMDKVFPKEIYKVRKVIERIPLYREIKKETDLTIFKNSIAGLDGKNFYYPTYMQLAMFNAIPGITSKATKFPLYKKIITEFITNALDSKKYSNSYLVIDMQYLKESLKSKSFSENNGMTPWSIIYLWIKEASETKEKILGDIGKNVDIVFYDSNSKKGFIFDGNKNPIKFSKFKSSFKALTDLSMNIPIDENVLNDVTKPEVALRDSKSKFSSSSDIIEKQTFYFVSEENNQTITIPKNTTLETDMSLVISKYYSKKFNIDYNYSNGFKFQINKEDLDSIRETNLFLYKLNTSDFLKFEIVNLNTIKNKTSVQLQLFFDLKLDNKTKPLIFENYDKMPTRIEFDYLNKLYDESYVMSKKALVLKDLKLDSSAIPLDTAQKELINQIDDILEEIAREYELENENTLNKKELDEVIKSNDVLQKVILALSNSRLLSVQNFKQQQVVNSLEVKHNEALLIIDGQEINLSDKFKEIEEKAISPKKLNVDVVNEEISESTLKAFKEQYQDNLYEKDQYEAITSFGNSEDIPIFVESINRFDSSDAMNKKDTIEVKYLSAGNKPQTMKIDIPHLNSDGYLFLNGARKQITTQITFLPIVKINSEGEDVVQYTTNYNKIFISRARGTLNPFVGSLKKAIGVLNTSKKIIGKGYSFLLGDAERTNSGLFHSLEYVELSKFVVSIKIDKCEINFSRNDLIEILSRKDISWDNISENIPKDFYPVGYEGKSVFVSDMLGRIFIVTNEGKNFDSAKFEYVNISRLVKEKLENSAIDEEVKQIISSTKFTGKTIAYSQLKVANMEIPIIVFLGYKIGLTAVMDKYKIPYEISDSNKSIHPEYSVVLRFKDSYLHFDDTEIRHSLLVNGLRDLDTKNIAISDLNKNGNAYHEYFASTGVPRYGKALSNFYSLFIDPITKHILDDHGIDSTIEGSFLYCNTLLELASYSDKSDMSLYRVRHAEIINSILYKMVARNIEKFRRIGQGDSPAGLLSLRSDALLKELMVSPVVDDAPILNPTREIENIAKATYKGPGGSGFKHGKGTEDTRFYSNSMLGLFGVSTPDDNNAGVTRKISMNSNIKTVRGYLQPNNNETAFNATNMHSVGELLGSFNAQHADSPRQGMFVTQTSHQLATKKMHKALVSSGGYKVIPKMISNDFVMKAQQDGVVEEVNMENNIMVLKYADGTKGIIDLEEKHRRSPDGFFVAIKQETILKKGSKFKIGDILSADKFFFNGNGNNVEMSKGTLVKVAMACKDTTFEDSSSITADLAGKLAATIIMNSSLTLNKDANLGKIVKLGDEVKTSDPLAIFEESFTNGDGSVTELLENIGENLDEALDKLATNMKTSKYTGKIVDIRVYYNYDIEEYSPSLKKFIKHYISKHRKRSEALKGIRKDQFVDNRDVTPTYSGKAGGQIFDGILIDFFIEMEDEFSVGDKLTADTSIKSIVAEIIPSELSPYSEFDKAPVELVFSPLSAISRMTQDVFFLMYTNKVLIGLKDKIRDIYLK